MAKMVTQSKPVPAGKRQLPEKLKSYQFKPGQSGNPKGREKGSRAKFGEQFVKDFMEHWKEHGAKAMDETAKKHPDVYVRVAASIIPKELNLTNDSETTIQEFLEEYSGDSLKELLAGLRAFGSASTPH